MPSRPETLTVVQREDSEHAIGGELTRILYSHAPTTGLVFLMLSWLVCLVLWDTSSHRTLLLWVGAVHLGTAGRYLLGWRFSRANPDDREMGPWRLGAMLSALYHGLVWGGMAPLLISGEPVNLIIVVTILLGLGAASMVVASAHLPSLFLYLLSSMGLLILTLGMRGDALSWTVLLVALAALGAYIVHGLRVHRFVYESLRLRFENLGLRLQQEEKSRQLEAALQHMGQGMGMADSQGRLRLWNQRFLDLLGAPAARPLDDVDALLARFAPGLDPEPGGGAEYERSDGQVIELAQGSMPNGGRVLTLTDITEHKRRERSLEAARQSAEQANRAKTHFLSVASHDLRQPIHALGLFFHNLAEQVRGPDTQPMIDAVEETIRLIDGMLGDLLDISKLDARVVQPSFGAVEVNMLFKQLEAKFAPIAQERGNRLRIRPCRYWVRSDASMLLRILGNLLDNALKFTQHGRVLLAARVRGDRLRCEIYDTGPGIPVENREEIFQEFHQLDNPQRDRRQGLGLGLAIVRRLTDLLGHRLSLSSIPGRGSCFVIELPLAEAETLAPAAAPERPPPGEELRGLRALLLDDDSLVQTAVGDLLRGWGCEVQVAAGLAEAEELVGQSQAPDVMLVDYRLPGPCNGAEAIERLQARIGHPVPALIVTADTAPECLQEAESKGYRLLHKPAQPAKLRSLLRHLVGRGETGPQ